MPEIVSSDLVSDGSGVRAQAVRPDGSMVDDFQFVQSDKMLHVWNVPSPAATASLPIGRHIAELARKGFGNLLSASCTRGRVGAAVLTCPGVAKPGSVSACFYRIRNTAISPSERYLLSRRPLVPTKRYNCRLSRHHGGHSAMGFDLSGKRVAVLGRRQNGRDSAQSVAGERTALSQSDICNRPA